MPIRQDTILTLFRLADAWQHAAASYAGSITQAIDLARAGVPLSSVVAAIESLRPAQPPPDLIAEAGAIRAHYLRRGRADIRRRLAETPLAAPLPADFFPKTAETTSEGDCAGPDFLR